MLYFYCYWYLRSLRWPEQLCGAVGKPSTDLQRLPIAGAAVQLTAVSTGAIRRRRHQPTRGLRSAGTLARRLRIENRGIRLSIAKQTCDWKSARNWRWILCSDWQRRGRCESHRWSEVLHTTDASVGEVVEPTSIRETTAQRPYADDLVLTVPGAHVGLARKPFYKSALLETWATLCVVIGARDECELFFY